MSPQPQTTRPLVSLRGVSAGYERKPVIFDVDLQIWPGQYVGLVGPSGSGKTTLLRTLVGTATVLSGSVDYGRGKHGRPRSGYVPQLETVDWNFPITVEQAVMLGRWREMGWRPWPGREDRRRVRQLLDRLGIGDLHGRHIRELSGGQQQRVFLARALIGDPDILLLDEPTSGVDVKTRDEILHLLKDLNADGVSIILTTHDLNAVAAHLPEVVCINQRVLAHGTPEEVFRPEILNRAYDADMLVLRVGGMLLVVDRPHVDTDALTSEAEGGQVQVVASAR
jgi:ABC-type Mn2+/Zn2+ transport system ATPase subunit